MNPLEIKTFLWKNGLSVAEMARTLENENRKAKSIATMISDMIYGRRYYPALAEEIEKEFGLKFERIPSARELVRDAA